MYWLWPCNVPHWLRWQQLQTQWRYAPHGMGGRMPTGLDYASVSAWLQAHGCHARGRKDRHLGQALGHIQACEAGHLQAVAEISRREG